MFNREKLRIERLKRHLTQAELGRQSYISTSTICGYEQGRRSPSIDGLCRLAKVLGIPAAELIQENE